MNDPTKVERKINIVELASELAGMELKTTYSGMVYYPLGIYQKLPCQREYTKKAQDIFNSLYDKYWNLINKFSEVIK